MTVGTWPVSRLLMILAFVLFLLAALIGGGVITMGESGWLIPGGLASMALALALP